MTARPSAWPRVAFMTSPTKNPDFFFRSLSSPAMRAAQSSGCSAMMRSTMASSSPESMASNPFAEAMAAGSPPSATREASTVLACVAVRSPPVSRAMRAANDSAVRRPTPSARLFSR